jgi:hypothetical protein
MALAFGVDSCADRFVVSRGTPGGDAGRRAIEFVARHVRDVDTEEQADLLRDSCKHLVRRDALGDQGRDPPQRGLLVREPGELLAACAVRDRRGDQLREPGEPILNAVREAFTFCPAGRHHTPHVAVDDDRGAGRRANLGFPYDVGDRRVDVGEVFAPRGMAGLPDACDDHRVVERPAAADLKQMRRVAPGADHGPRPIGLVAPHRDQRNAEHSRHLAGDRGEHLRRRRPPATSAAIRRRDASRAARIASCSLRKSSACRRCSMSVKATTAPRPSAISIGTET